MLLKCNQKHPGEFEMTTSSISIASVQSGSTQTVHHCPCCTCNELPLVDNLIWEARARIESHKAHHRIPFESIDDSILIIEDEFGGLMYHEGDLSFLMPQAPVLDQIFSDQLNPGIQKDYELRQLAVWDMEMPELRGFRSECGRIAFIFPLHVGGQRYTATVFSTRVA
jgi:hypothetical protein